MKTKRRWRCISVRILGELLLTLKRYNNLRLFLVLNLPESIKIHFTMHNIRLWRGATRAQNLSVVLVAAIAAGTSLVACKPPWHCTNCRRSASENHRVRCCAPPLPRALTAPPRDCAAAAPDGLKK